MGEQPTPAAVTAEIHGRVVAALAAFADGDDDGGWAILGPIAPPPEMAVLLGMTARAAGALFGAEEWRTRLAGWRPGDPLPV